MIIGYTSLQHDTSNFISSFHLTITLSFWRLTNTLPSFSVSFSFCLSMLCLKSHDMLDKSQFPRFHFVIFTSCNISEFAFLQGYLALVISGSIFSCLLITSPCPTFTPTQQCAPYQAILQKTSLSWAHLFKNVFTQMLVLQRHLLSSVILSW